MVLLASEKVCAFPSFTDTSLTAILWVFLKVLFEIIHFLWWRQRDSNPRPQRCERCALPAELCPHVKAVTSYPRIVNYLPTFFNTGFKNIR